MIGILCDHGRVQSSKATHTHTHTPFKAFPTRNSAWLSQGDPVSDTFSKQNTSLLLGESHINPYELHSGELVPFH